MGPGIFLKYGKKVVDIFEYYSYITYIENKERVAPETRRRHKMEKTMKQMKQEIKDKYAARPEGQITTGIYLHSIGRKYVTILNTWGTSKLTKEPIEDFYAEYVA